MLTKEQVKLLLLTAVHGSRGESKRSAAQAICVLKSQRCVWDCRAELERWDASCRRFLWKLEVLGDVHSTEATIAKGTRSFGRCGAGF